MKIITILLIALALAVDAFAVALATGVALCKATHAQTLRMAWCFGFFQGAMSIIGWTAGLSIRSLVENTAPWIAFGLLVFIGSHMIIKALRHDDIENRKTNDPTKGKTLLLLGVATSIDALAVGLSFAVLGVSIWLPALIIAIVAMALTVIGLRLGCLVGSASKLGSRAEIAGGLVLVGIGVKILYEHGIF